MRTIATRLAVALAATGLLFAAGSVAVTTPAAPTAIHARPAGLSWD